MKMDESCKVLTDQPNTTCRSSTAVFYYILQHVLAVRISHHQIHKKCKGREACPYSGMNYNNIIPKNGIIRLKLIANPL